MVLVLSIILAGVTVAVLLTAVNVWRLDGRVRALEDERDRQAR